MTRIVQWKQMPARARVDNEKDCDNTYAYVLAGHGTTDAHGVYRIDLRTIVCDPPGLREGTYPSITALTTYGVGNQKAAAGFIPHPYLLSAFIFGHDLTIHSFQVDGKTPQPNVTVSWHMVFEGELVKKN
ncbi:MAG TPA: hypothetical protein VN181_00180 [Thermoanaerobaculia bacterium]|nr:hypothetical protein [Thermoanaerobaculia bacterium]